MGSVIKRSKTSSKNGARVNNAQMTGDCIPGIWSVMARSFPEERCAIAGNPARVIRRGITWKPQHTEKFIENIRPMRETP